MTHMVDVFGQDADRMMIGFAHRNLTLSIADNGVNTVTY
jgi:hypothetical protein